jgi:Fic family protein
MFQPRYTITPKLLAHIKQITLLIHDLNALHLSGLALARLQAEARVISAYASTSIEGNPLPLTEVRRLLKNHPDQVRNSELELLNYNQALVELSNNPSTRLDEETLLTIHRLVMEGLLPAYQNGRFRQEPVVVHDPRNGEIVYLPPDWQDVPGLVADLLTFASAQQGVLDAVILAGLFHKQMVIIHPFVDGNGRTTRLATKLLLANVGLNTFNLFSFENYYNQNVTRYFRQVGLAGSYDDLIDALDFTPWLEYFAEGVLDELHRVAKEIQRNRATPSTTLKPHHQHILAYIDEHGFITDRDYAQLTDRAKATRTLDFNRLIEMGVISRHGVGRAIYYKRT